MKNLKDVLEKLKVDDIILTEKFPIDGTLYDMVEFLKEKNFKEISNGFDNYLYNAFEDAIKEKVYLMLDKEIFFADTSKEKISKDNPIFYCSDKGKLNILYFDYTHNHYIDIVIGKDNSTKQEFLKELNKRFRWK